MTDEDRLASKTCQWDQIPKQVFGAVALCPVCDQKALHQMEDAARRRETGEGRT